MTPHPVGLLPPQRFAELLQRTPAEHRFALMRLRYRYDRPSFCRYAWPDRFTLPFNELHYELFARQMVPSYLERTEAIHEAIAAPRGFAKSTIESFAGLVHDIVYDVEACIVLMSAGLELSLNLSRDLREQFLIPDSPLAKLYGPFLVSGTPKQWEVSVQGRPTVAVFARSFGTEVRGLKHPTRGIRPTKVLIDDGEKPDDVRNPDQRSLQWSRFTKDILKLGDTRMDRTLYKVAGTILHPEALLARLMAHPGWSAKKWKAIIKWPTNTDLWEKCRLIWVDLTKGDKRRKLARAFYRANRAAMDEGSELLDPKGKDLFQLYEIIWSEGLGAFLSEFQNEPTDPDSQIFFSERFARFRHENGWLLVLDKQGQVTRRVEVKKLRITAHWDPSTGSVTGDPAAYVVVGRDEWGYTYVLGIWMAIALPSRQLAAVWTLSERWKCRYATVESVAFSNLVAEPFPREKVARKLAGKFWDLTLDPRNQQANKELRISALEPDITNGWILFADDIPGDALGQFDAFPTGEHDDAPDALEGAWQNAGGRPATMEQVAA